VLAKEREEIAERTVGRLERPGQADDAEVRSDVGRAEARRAQRSLQRLRRQALGRLDDTLNEAEPTEQQQ
jgi:hypothetical protein